MTELTTAEAEAETARLQAEEEAKKTPKSFTQEQLDDIVSKRVNEEKTKSEKSTKDQIAEAIAEADRKAKLSADERSAEEKLKSDKQLTERETTLALRESRIEARDLLQSKGIAIELVDFVIDADIEKTKSNIETLEKSYTKAVEAGVAEKLKGKAPEDFSGNGGTKTSSHKIERAGQTAF